MGKILVIALIIVVMGCDQQQSVNGQGGQWSYDDIPAWGNSYPICNNGKYQSPIALSLEDAVYATELVDRPLTFKNYDNPIAYQGQLTNSGHSVSWSFDSSIDRSSRPSISGSQLMATYTLSAIHFHWGSSSSNINQLSSCFGSEHLVEYRPAPMEAHFVHYNSKYANFKEAQTQPDGLAVLGYLFKPVESGTRVAHDYSAIVKDLPSISEPNSTIMASMLFKNLVPANGAASYFRYEGSLTTPPCYETVLWSVFVDRIEMPVDQLQVFQTALKSMEKDPVTGDYNTTLENNYRPIQKRYGRVIWRNVKTSDDPTGSAVSGHQLNSFFMIITIISGALLNKLAFFN